MRSRWLSRRAVLLHLYLLLIAPGCLLAGWWQATRALSGNKLSWFYSIEWPAFAVIAVLGWWHLLHEDPEAYKARKERIVEVVEPYYGPSATAPASAADSPATPSGEA